MSIITDTDRPGIIAGLRALADRLEADPLLPLPDATKHGMAVFCHGRGDIGRWRWALGSPRMCPGDGPTFHSRADVLLEGLPIRLYSTERLAYLKAPSGVSYADVSVCADCGRVIWLGTQGWGDPVWVDDNVLDADCDGTVCGETDESHRPVSADGTQQDPGALTAAGVKL